MKGKREIVTEKFLTEIFSSQDFGESVLKAADICKRKKRETGFSVVKRLSSDQIWYTDIRVGGPDTMRGAKKTKRFMDLVYDQRNYELVHIHFHPGRDITPSDADLRAPLIGTLHQQLIGCRVKPIHGVGVELYNKQIGVPIVLYQLKKPPKDFKSFCSSFSENTLKEGVEFAHQADFLAYAFGKSKTRPRKRRYVKIEEVLEDTEYPLVVAKELEKGGYYKTAVLNVYLDGEVYEGGIEKACKFSFNAKRFKPRDLF